MKADADAERVSAFAKRLLQQSLHGPPTHAAAALFLLSHVRKPAVAALLDRAARADAAHDPGHVSDDDDAAGAAGAAPPEAASYDASAREPKGAHAVGSALWELALLGQHFHPSVRAFAAALADKAVRPAPFAPSNPLRPACPYPHGPRRLSPPSPLFFPGRAHGDV
jgi:hypothetical protein